jgi:hypothetical protein
MKNWSLLALLCGLLLASSPLRAQVKAPAPSPFCSLTQMVGLTEMTLEYSRPGVKDRTVFGDLVPYGKIWRTGANASSKITFSNDVTFGGQEVPAGTYALYTMPGKNEWTVMVYKDLSLGGNVANYDQSNELTRFTVKPEAMPGTVESLLLYFDQLTDEGANLVLAWEETLISIPVGVNTDEAVMASIEQTMDGPSANDYFQAAVYYFNTDRDLAKAVEWIDTSLEMRPAYWVMTWKARMQGKMGNYTEAMATSKKAMEMAKEAQNADYVKMNEDLMAEFKKKM